jgi:hypothetical protein
MSTVRRTTAKTLRKKQPAYYRLGELFGVQKEA